MMRFSILPTSIVKRGLGVVDTLTEAENEIVRALGPLVVAQLTEAVVREKYIGTWIDKVNETRAGPKDTELVPPVNWDLTDLLRTMEDFWYDVWPAFAKLPSNRQVKSVELKSCVTLLKQLRHRARHRPRTSFSEKDEGRFLDLGEHLVRSSGNSGAADKIQRARANKKSSSREVPPEIMLMEGDVGTGGKHRTKQLTQELENIESMRAHPVVIDFLARENATRVPLYTAKPASLMKQSVGKIQLTLPISALAVHGNIKLESFSEKCSYTAIKDVEDDEYIHLRKALGVPLENNPAYAIENINIENDECTIAGSMTDYYSMLVAHDALEFELYSAARRLKDKDALTVEALERAVPKRALFWEQTPSDRRRYAIPGISTLIAFKSAEGCKLMIRKRSSITASHTNLLHVIPSGCIQDKWDIEHCVIKEFSEELFSEEFNSNRENPNYIYKEWKSAKILKEALESGDCELVHTGVVMNLPSLRPEICCTLLFHHHTVFEQLSGMFDPNWEYVSYKDVWKTGQTKAMTYFDVERVEEQFLEISRGSVANFVGDWCPTGLAAFWLGVQAIKSRA